MASLTDADGGDLDLVLVAQLLAEVVGCVFENKAVSIACALA